MRKPRPVRGAAVGRLSRTYWNKKSTTISRPHQSVHFLTAYRGPRPIGEVVEGLIEQIGRRAIVWNLSRASALRGADAGAAFRSANRIRLRLGFTWDDLGMAMSGDSQ